MAAKILPFDEYATKLYEPTKQEQRMLVNVLSGDERFFKVIKPKNWDEIMCYHNSQEHPDVTKAALRNLWLSYAAYLRRMAR
jgi:hypothetical protein